MTPCNEHDYRLIGYRTANRARIAQLQCLHCGATLDRITARSEKQLAAMLKAHDAKHGATEEG